MTNADSLNIILAQQNRSQFDSMSIILFAVVVFLLITNIIVIDRKK